MLLDLAGEWTGIMHEAGAKAKMDEMKKNIAETWFAWSGPTEKGSAAYLRIQGPTVIIEYAPQRMGGDSTKHIHTIYRDPTMITVQNGPSRDHDTRLSAVAARVVWQARKHRELIYRAAEPEGLPIYWLDPGSDFHTFRLSQF